MIVGSMICKVDINCIQHRNKKIMKDDDFSDFLLSKIFRDLCRPLISAGQDRVHSESQKCLL